MDVLECITARRSIRKYKDMEVEMDKVGKVLYAARDAPSSGNLQNWKFILVTDEDTRIKLAEASLNQYWMSEAPVHIVVCAEPEKAEQYYGIRGERLYSIQNCAAAIQNMLLAATAEGLGSCWVGAFEEEMVKRILDIPGNIRVQAIVTLGYANETPDKKPWKHELYTICFLHSWDNRIKDINDVLGYHCAKVHAAARACKNGAEKGLDAARKYLKKKTSRSKE